MPATTAALPRHRPAPDRAAVLTKAVLRAAERLGLRDGELARVLGVSPASLSRLRRGRTVDPASKEGELALLLVAAWRSLDGVAGGEEAAARAWVRASNRHLGGVPAELVRTAAGLVHVLQYLEALRSKG